jgi:asparagine synthase (glutamine-hydrolysing)
LNEGDVACRTARHFDTEHYEWRLDSTAGKVLIKEFLAHLDQPSIDGFNTFCVSKHAHDHGAKVVLSGLGGDELFGSYSSFQTVPRLAKLGRWASLAGPCARSVGRLIEKAMPRPRHRRLGCFLTGPPSMAKAYWTMRGIFTPAEVERLLRVYLGECGGTEDGAATYFHVPAQPSAEDQVSYLEISRYMRNQLLRDSDVMSMAWGLELRVPFVDRKLVETLVRIPARLRLAPGKGLLLDAVPEIPPWVAEGPKRGFVFPFEDWIAEEWRDVFARLDAASPLRLQKWYRRWCLFTLESFLDNNGMDAGRLGNSLHAVKRDRGCSMVL